PHDLVIAKLCAGRDRDVVYARAALQAGIVDLDTLIERAAMLDIDNVQREHVLALLKLAGQKS
ncbi:MAG: hypothetical protein ABI200_08220, partial [Gaiellales bacterium]